MLRRAPLAIGKRQKAVFPWLSTSCRYASSLNTRDIVEGVTKLGIFDESLVKSTTERFIGGLAHTSYGNVFTNAEVISHIHGVLNAEARWRMGDSFEYIHETDGMAFYVCGNEERNKQHMVRKMALFAARDNHANMGAVMRSYLLKDGSLAVYSCRVDPYINPTPAEGECRLESVATQSFLDSVARPVQERAQALLNQLQNSVFPVFEVTNSEVEGEVCFSMAMSVERTNYVASLLAIFQEIQGASVVRSFSYSFSNGAHIYNFYVRGATAAQIKERASHVGLLPSRPTNAVMRLHEASIFTCEQAVFVDAAIIFAFYFTPSPTTDDYRHLRAVLANEPNGINRLNNLRSTLSQEVMSERYIGSLIAMYPQFMKDVFEDFRSGSTVERRRAIASAIEKQLKEDQRTPYDLSIFMSFLKFNEVVLKHNFFKVAKAALAFRLDPSFLKDLEFPRVPHGLYLLAGGQWRGFHIRFTDIARGGVRMIMSKDNTYRKNKRSVFQENYNLALTQLLKNKDIPEGGSKGTILVSSRYLNKFDEPRCRRIFLQYVDALLDVIIPGENGVVDQLKQEEILFLGPDENTAGSFPAAGALYSKKRGYSAWKSFTTGKDPVLGGVPHDVYGMTTHSVRTYVRGVYEKLGLEEASMRKFQTGGPDGDLGSNEILKSKEKMVGMVDISASLHDPNGIDRVELTRLAKQRLPLREFNRAKLSKEGFLVLTEDRDVTLPDGTKVADGSRFRDEFHFLPYSDADVFVPCGGRPRSVTLENVGRFLKVKDADGESMMTGKYENLNPEMLKFKIIVEGANLFISQDARLALERCGVVLIKDASSNKGGVTSSSLEVYAGLALSDEEHARYMSAKNEHEAPEFYKQYVQCILDRIERNARNEFEAIWREWEKQPTMAKVTIADTLSSKNVQIRANILSSDIFKNKALVRYILTDYTPKVLLDVVPIDTLMERVPETYQHAICAMWLASNYVYSTGINSNEFHFFRYMSNVFERAGAFKDVK